MPSAKSKSKSRAPARRRMGRRRMGRRLPANVPEWASSSDIREAQVLETNQMYGPSAINLSQFKRASSIARNYQQYRITKVKFTFKPLFDTFAATTNAASQLVVPYLYYMIDKNASIPTNATLATLQAMGAKPRRFDDKSIVVQWSPAYVMTDDVASGGSPFVKPFISPWLNTNETPATSSFTPSAATHFGLWYYLDAGGLPGDGEYEYECDVEIQVQFRKPLLPVAANGLVAKNAVMTFKDEATVVLPLASSAE